ncbi:MAG: helix-turn-helix domain-containing protein [Gammaproteobacteria bacterium]|nr:helix-turn-helix domain-containing protein [Gammaproteobacteria bacterium]
MNAGSAEDNIEQDVLDGPGKKLKALRVAKNLDLGRVASLLHLSEEKLRSLEAEDYQALPGPVFIQGYIRNYARLLGVSPEPLLSAFRSQNPEKDRHPELRISQVQHEVQSSHLLMRLMTWVIVIGLVVLVVIWWKGYLKWPLMMNSTPNQENSQNISEEEDDGGPGFASLPSFFDGPDDETDSTTGGNLSLPSLEQMDEQETPSGINEKEVPAIDEAPPPSETEVSPPSQPVADEPLPDTPTTVTETPPAATETARVVVLFKGKSWTRISDASGRFKIQEEISAGSRRALQGDAPYELVLGNASVVEITIDGEVFDLTPHIRGNVARFTLDPDRISR